MTEQTEQTAPASSGTAPAEATDYYTLWAVLRRHPHTPAAAEDGPALADAIAGLESLRGIYDVSGLRADADIMLWLTGPSAQQLQAELRMLRRTRELAGLLPTWNALGVHRDAEFSRDHMPAFARGLAPKDWVTVYPFVRSYEWYLLPAAERGEMLRDHGLKGREYPQVLSNTVASFALGDYEWLLGLEADDPVDLVDLMRHLRATEARRHVREEIPFFTGRRISADEVAEVIA
ncbi:hydrogen peroxide-dependent heme synthase [Microbacterium hominis]|uniref:Coproheme decarboxylase n=1 Tax=Microbacterium hominis TaxID=162426 RepID=A0A7D4QHR4_9MICO|nr:hydrogen peroxide-dependent heme synthase [Microbacterium hominis]QKJ18996.1 chlorite dismutase family protein [Microbacterium hominis]